MRFLYAAVVAVSVLTVSGCGGDGGDGDGGGGGGDQRAAYMNCLRENGVTLPSGRPSGRPNDRPSGAPDGSGDDAPGDAPDARPSGAPSGRPSGGPGGFRSMSPEMRKAMEACRSLMPEGGRGPGGYGGGPGGYGGGPGGPGSAGGDEGRGPDAADTAALRPFLTCLKDNGAEVAEGKSWRNLDQNDPKVAAAVKKCRTLLPEPSAQPSA